MSSIPDGYVAFPAAAEFLQHMPVSIERFPKLWFAVNTRDNLTTWLEMGRELGPLLAAGSLQAYGMLTTTLDLVAVPAVAWRLSLPATKRMPETSAADLAFAGQPVIVAGGGGRPLITCRPLFWKDDLRAAFGDVAAEAVSARTDAGQSASSAMSTDQQVSKLKPPPRSALKPWLRMFMQERAEAGAKASEEEAKAACSRAFEHQGWRFPRREQWREEFQAVPAAHRLGRGEKAKRVPPNSSEDEAE